MIDLFILSNASFLYEAIQAEKRTEWNPNTEYKYVIHKNISDWQLYIARFIVQSVECFIAPT